MSVDLRELDRLAARQDGIATRPQLIGLGATSDWISRQTRRRRFQRVSPGIYAVYTGPLRWRSRARAALFYCGEGAILSHDTAAFHRSLRRAPGDIIHVSVPAHRRVRERAGLRIHRRRRMPPAWGALAATTVEATVVDLAESMTVSQDELISLLCAAAEVGARPEEVLSELSSRMRVRHRQLFVDMLTAVNAGIESPMEYRYMHGVEQAHGLPRAELQVREVIEGRYIRADTRYRRYRLRVELDGQLAHPGGTTDSDVWRDNAVLIKNSEATLRYRWRHVTVLRCRTAIQVGSALRHRGWQEPPRPCGSRCPVGTHPW